MKKILILGVIVLFIGLAFIPSFNAVSISKDIEETNPVVDDIEKDCLECQSNGKTHLAEKLLNRLEKDDIFKEILNNPFITKINPIIFNEFDNKINPIGPLPPNFFKCCMLFGKLLIITYTWVFIRGIYLRLDKMGYEKLASRVSNIWENLNVSFFQTQEMMYDLNCEFF